MKQGCRACGEVKPLYRLDVTVNAKSRARRWRVEVCRDCWRAWEALLDQGSATVQFHLGDGRAHNATWFL